MSAGRSRRAALAAVAVAAFMTAFALVFSPAPPANAAPAAPARPAAVVHAAVMTVRASPASVTDGVGAGPGGSAAGNRALNWAEQHAGGHWYCYGGTGPSCYDCSGLVMEAFARGAGIALPRTTYGMPGSPRLHRIPLASARRGDILFYGPGHVELDTVWAGVSYGAHDAGSLIGWIRWGFGWVPTAAYRVFLCNEVSVRCQDLGHANLVASARHIPDPAGPANRVASAAGIQLARSATRPVIDSSGKSGDRRLITPV